MKEILAENELYKDVVTQITQRLALRDAVENANRQLQQSQGGARSEHQSEAGTIITTISRAERMIDTFDKIDVGPQVGPISSHYSRGSQRSDLVSQKRSVQE